MMHDREKSDPTIVAGKPTNKAGNRQRNWWSQGGGRGECEPAKHISGTGSGTCVTSAGTQTAGRKNAAICRYTPKVAAVCGKAARMDLCGGAR